jgi:tetratricopeptide (TPR) repeat protein
MLLLLLALQAQALLAQSGDFAAEGLKALDAQKYDDAASLFSKAVAADPTDYSAHFNLALTYSFMNKDAEAISEYERVLALHPSLYEAELNLGISLLRNKQAAAALPHLTSASDQKAQEFRPRFYVAEALFANQQYADAETAYRSALQQNPSSAAAEVGLGRSLAREGRLEDAEPHYRTAAASDPAYRDLLLELATAYEEKQKPARAMAIYREFPTNPGAQERLGALLLQSGDSAAAIQPLEFAVAQSPTAANRLALAQAYVREKQPAKADPLAAAALQASPDDFELRMFYARLLRDQRKFPEAANQFYTAAQKQPDSVEAWTELSGIFMVSEQYPQALAALDKVRALGAETNSHVFIRALAFDHLHQAKDALENYNKFLAGSHGEHPDQEFQARQRSRILERELGKR